MTMMMNGTSTHVGDNTTYSSALRPGCGHEGWASGMMCLWSNWSIQLFVLLGLILQTFLAVLGSRRKTSSAKPMTVVIWATYLLASYISTLALGKLSSITLNKSDEEYNTELIALLAPLTLLLLGNPDSITAFSVEDNWLGSRHVLNLVITFRYVVWILARSWKTSVRMILYFQMFVAGIIEYGETIWAVYSAYAENTKMTPGRVEKSAYHRFNGLKPHLGDWLKNPYSMSYRSILIDEYIPEDIFLITDVELGFTYDVLYTKAPVLYTKSGITLRFISYFSLLLTLGGFIGLFLVKLFRDPYLIYTLGLLIGVMLRQTYQLLELFYSDWLIIMKWKHLENPMVLKFLKFLVERSLKKDRWSNRIRQFNLLDFCQSDQRPWLFRIP
ncbi:uncharacterized protein LOC115736066 [Rhodamnia argentea]|uniref:Uncharacterized protein LOC115736066 n=1 Tax=Rhodamnia argentea TaxID=178133 RepID=A0ABM3HBH1_9MYRT|nr:uncharacterized protein LOC115736066 [Rhodamnia argentea]